MGITKGPWYLIDIDGTDFTIISTDPLTEKNSIDYDSEVLGSSEWIRLKKEDAILMAASWDLLNAAETAIKILKRNLYRQTEKCEDALSILSNAVNKAKDNS